MVACLSPLIAGTRLPHRARWLSIVGIGEDGVDGLSAGGARARSARPRSCSAASAISRLAAPLIRGAARPGRARSSAPSRRCWRTAAGRSACSPPAIRSTTASARCWRAASIRARCWSCRRPPPSASPRRGSAGRCRTTALLSLHGRAARSRPPASAARRAHPGADLRRRRAGRARARCWRDTGFGALAAHRAGGARRAARAHPHDDRRATSISARSTRSTRWRSRSRPRPARASSPRAAGLPDDLFEHDGQITKREIRAVTLSSLAPRRGELLWDIGAGAGSVAIEWMLADPRCARSPSRRAPTAPRASAATPPPSACRHSRSCEGAAPAALAGLPPPDAIFIGGGASDAGRARCGDRRACAAAAASSSMR